MQDEAISSAEADAAFDTIFGAGARPACDFTKADVILSIGSDFLNPAESGFGYANGFAARRDPKGSMNRLYVAENGFSLTGGMADHRIRVRASAYGDFVAAVAAAVAARTGDANLKALASAYQGSGTTFDPAWIKGVADDLVSAKGKSLVLVGVRQPSAVRALVIGINAALGNLGTTVTVRQSGAKSAAKLADLCAAIKAGSVKTLLILGGNPVHTAPISLDFPNLLARVPETLHLSLFADETSKVTHWQVPAAHYLESWGDTRSLDGTVSPVQPMILPLWNGISAVEILAALAGEKVDGPSAVRATFAGYSKDATDAAWQTFLKNGFAAGTAWSVAAPNYNQAAALASVQSAKPASNSGGDFEVVFLRSSSVDDGRYASNSWLQETPDFVTKLVWDNAALVSPADARALGIKDGSWIRITAGDRYVDAAALIAPGQADRSVSIALGYGRNGVSHVMEKVGFDAYPLRDSSGLAFRSGVSVKALPKDSCRPICATGCPPDIWLISFSIRSRGWICDRSRSMTAARAARNIRRECCWLCCFIVMPRVFSAPGASNGRRWTACRCG